MASVRKRRSSVLTPPCWNIPALAQARVEGDLFGQAAALWDVAPSFGLKVPNSMPPRTQYTKSGNVSIAYQVLGNGPIDLVYAQGWITNVEYAWENPDYARFLTRLGTSLVPYASTGVAWVCPTATSLP